MIGKQGAIAGILFILSAFPIIAQSDLCPALVENALNTVGEVCAELGRNQACYGNGNITALDFDNAPINDFDVSGDRTDLISLRSLVTTPLDVDANLWGVALLALQADLPDTIPGQNVTFVVFGDTELTNEVSPVELAEVSANPSSQYTSPMQAFHFSTGIGAPACEEAPQDGLLVQAPAETTVHFRINGIEVEVGSTALLRLEDEVLGVNTFDGTVSVTSAGETQTAEPGFRIDASPDTTPTEPEPYDYSDVRTAPVDLLPEPIAIPITVSSVFPDWVDTDIQLVAGQAFTIIASGNANLCGFGENPDCVDDPVINQYVGPDGNTDFEICEGQFDDCLLMPGIYGALVGRIGDSDAFHIGEGGDFIADNDGELQLGYNDHRYDDNDGAFIVVVEIANE